MLVQGKYTLVNPDKVERALNGILRADNSRAGGVGDGAYYEEGTWKRDGVVLNEKDVEVLENNLLAEYDKQAGYIKVGDDKVKTGSFYDFKARKPRIVPKVVYTYRINGKNVDVEDGVQLPGIVMASKVMKSEEKKGKKKKSDEE